MEEIVHCLPYFGFFLLALIALGVLFQAVVGELTDLERTLDRYRSATSREERGYIRKMTGKALGLKRIYIVSLTTIAIAGLAFLGALCTGQEQFANSFLEIVKRLK